MIRNIPNYEGFSITFNTGEDCNLACKYCYEINKKKSVLSLDHAKRFIDLILTDNDPINAVGTKHEWILNQGLIMDFIGGDALMHPQLVEDIVKYFIRKAHLLNHKWKDRWRLSITTNGTLFDREEVRRFVEKYKENLSITVSIDGCPEIHDLNRIYVDGTGSMKTIRKWWDWYRNLYPETSTKSTLNKESIPYLFKSLKYMHEDMNLQYINQNFIFEDMQLEQSDLDELNKQMELCVNYVLEHKDDLYWSMIDERLRDSKSYTENCKERPNEGWCGSGAMPALSPDGKIYPCFRFLPHTQASGVDLSVGDIWNGFNRKENFVCIRDQTREKISPPKCKDCEIESGCSWCIAGAYSEKGHAFRPNYICEAQKVMDKWAKHYWSHHV
jgi:uncharacterized protein